MFNLFGERKRVESSNTTRRYLRAVLNGLSDTPAELVDVGLVLCADHKLFSPKMRETFRDIVGNPFREKEADDVW
jgi:hypothetical protein